MAETKTLMQRLFEAGYTGDIDNHYSDLYIEDTELTQKVIDEWSDDINIHKSLFIDYFVDQTSGKKMLDLAFQYESDWKEKYADLINKREREREL